MGVGLEREGDADWGEGMVNGTPQTGSADWKYLQVDTVTIPAANAANGKIFARLRVAR